MKRDVAVIRRCGRQPPFWSPCLGFARSRDAWAPVGENGALDGETPVYGRDLNEAEQYLADRLTALVLANEPLFQSV